MIYIVKEAQDLFLALAKSQPGDEIRILVTEDMDFEINVGDLLNTDWTGCCC